MRLDPPVSDLAPAAVIARRFSPSGDVDGRMASVGAEAWAWLGGVDKGGVSVVSEEMSLDGDVKCRGPLVICGGVVGDVECGDLIVDLSAVIEGSVVANRVFVMGRVEGDIAAEDLVLQTGSEVRGKIRYRSLRLGEGSYCEAPEPLLHDGELVIDGHVRGGLRCSDLTLGTMGRVDGDIVADKVVIHGQVFGGIQAPSVVLASTAEVVGDIFHRGLSIQRGAYFEGKARRVEGPLGSTARLVPR